MKGGFVGGGLIDTSGRGEDIGGGVKDGAGWENTFVSGAGGGVNGGGVNGGLGGLYGSAGGRVVAFWRGISELAKDGVEGWGSNVGVVG